MTIKQQGGIFGRNPTFNEVDATDITTESLSLLKNNPFVRLDDSDTDNNGEFRLDNTSVRIEADKDNAVAGSKIKFKIDNSEIGSFDENGHLDITGNLVVASGQGIDFSATSGTGTSELFDDYEEGNWTPTLTTDGTDFSSVTYDALTSGYYTKVGDLVVARGRLRTDAVTVGSASGNVLIGGLPFTVDGGATGRAPVLIGESEDFSTNNPSGGRTVESSVTARLFYRSSANGAATSLPVSSIDTGANKNQASFTIIYRV